MSAVARSTSHTKSSSGVMDFVFKGAVIATIGFILYKVFENHKPDLKKNCQQGIRDPKLYQSGR